MACFYSAPLAWFRSDVDTTAAYSYFDFKRDVLAWLTQKFGPGVKAGKKAIFIPGDGNRRDADVLVCAQHRSYSYYSSEQSNFYREGITFWTSSGDQIVNYPKHFNNCTTKHQATNARFKPSIRIIKNMRNTMIDRGLIEDGLAPSYFLEGMLSDVPSQHFVASRQNTFENYMYWLQNAPTGDMTCANGIHYLLRDGHSVCWNVATITLSRKELCSSGTARSTDQLDFLRLGTADAEYCTCRLRHSGL